MARVDLTLSDGFVSGLASVVTSARELAASLAASDAVWEPHNWGDF